MKTLKIAAIALTLAALAAAPVYAQSNGLRVDIPFEFHAADAVMPPGTYTVNLDVFSNRIEIRQERGTALSMFYAHLALDRRGVERSSLLFHRYGDRYFLRRVSTKGRKEALELSPSKAERESAKAGNGFTVALLQHSK